MSNATDLPPMTRAAEASPKSSSLRTRMRLYALLGLLVVGGWLYYTINQVLSLYDATVQISRYTNLRERTTDAMAGLTEAAESLDRYVRNGEGYDLSRHYFGPDGAHGRPRGNPPGSPDRGKPGDPAQRRGRRRGLRSGGRQGHRAARESAAGRIRRRARQPGGSGFGEAAGEPRCPGADLRAQSSLRRTTAPERSGRGDDRPGGARRLILAGLFWLLADVNRRILTPCAAASRALSDLARGAPPARLADSSRDEIGDLGLHFNEAARLYAERAQALEARDIEGSVNAVLAAAATINDLEGFGSKLLEKILDVTGASSAVIYVAEEDDGFRPAAAVGGSAGPDESAARDEARRAAREGRPVLVSVDARTPTVDLYDGRILPRESIHLPLMYFGRPVGVLALGAVRPFTERSRNTLTAIAPSLAVALANASANERLAAQSRRLAEQNELLEQQRSRIARTAQELQRASALKDRFLAAVSHELRTPMTVILGFTGTLLRGTQGELNPPQRESLERVQRNARLLLGLINDVLDISKIEAGKAELRREVVSVPTLLRQVETDFEETARRKGLTLTTRAAADLATVISDPAKLTQILANLVSNALKFTESGNVEVRAEARGRRRWALVVTDSGIGIPEDEQEAIFEEFRQGESTAHQARGGTGLGLAIVRKLATLLGGTVGVQSEPGRGSTFTVTLPCELPGGEPEAAPRPITAAAGRSRRALVVDDDESTRQLVRLELEPHGFAVIEASDGARAVELARRERPDVMVLDVLMPRLDGWTVLKALKEHADTRDIPVIIHSVVDNRARGVALGAFDCLVKPVQPGRLFEVLSRAGVLGFPGYVLIVDDDPDIRQLLERELSASGFRAVAVDGGEAALARIASERPAAVLLDLLMAEPDGFEVLCRIREDPGLKDVPVVIMTAKDLTPSDYERINGSAQRILKKGGDTVRLVRDTLGTVVQERTLAG